MRIDKNNKKVKHGMNELHDNIIAMNPVHLPSNSDLLPFEKISPRFVRILQKHNVRTYLELAHFTEYEFGKIRGFGETMLREAQCILEKKEMANSYSLSMRDRVIASMALSGENYDKIGAMYGISYQRVADVFKRIRTKYLFCNETLSTMRKTPDTYLHMLFDFPSLSEDR